MITVIRKCFALMHTIILFFSMHSSLPIHLFMLCLPRKFPPHHVFERRTQHFCLLPMGTCCAEEFQHHTLQSSQFRLQWLLRTRCRLQQHKNALLPVQTGQTVHTVSFRARLDFTQPQWASLKDLFTGIPDQTAVVLWGQTEINDGHDPMNVCVISKLNSWQIKTEWAIFVTCIFLLWKILINWPCHAYKFMRDQTKGQEN